MAKGDDYLEQLWDKVIDYPAKSRRIHQCLRSHDELAKGPFKEVYPALVRLIEKGVSQTDLERLAAFVRYEACFGVLVALDDPGLGKGRIAGIHKDFLRSRPKSRPRNQREKFIQWLWETEFFLNDDGKWLKDLTEKDLRARPFNRMFPAVQRLLQKVKQVKDLGRFLGWSRYQAAAETLRLLEEAGFQRGDEPCYLHEGLESAYSTGRGPTAKRKAGAPPDATKPLWHIKSAEVVAFSPDSQTLAVAGASSPMRLYDLATGQQRLACEGIRVHIYRIVFSPDGKQVTAGQIHRDLTVCDAKSGKLLHKLRRSDDEISGLEHAPGGELICSAWCGEIAVFSAKTGKTLPPLKVGEDDEMVDAITLFGKGTRLAVLWRSSVRVWSWPERRQLLDIPKVVSWSCNDIAASPDGKTLAIADKQQGVHLLDAAKGKRLGIVKVKNPGKAVFAPDGRHLILHLDEQEQLCLWDLKASREVCRLTPKGSVFDLKVSSSGEFLAAATDRGAFVWRLPALLR